MTDLNKLRSYADIRKFADPEAFSRATNFIAWHNRLTMTPMLEPWEALVVTLMHEERPIDGLFYTGLKTLLEGVRTEPVLSLEQAKDRAKILLEQLTQGK